MYVGEQLRNYVQIQERIEEVPKFFFIYLINFQNDEESRILNMPMNSALFKLMKM